jgi:hypothetical protein
VERTMKKGGGFANVPPHGCFSAFRINGHLDSTRDTTQAFLTLEKELHDATIFAIMLVMATIF